MSGVAVVLVERDDVEVAHQRERQIGVRRELCGRRCLQRLEPVQLVGVVRIVERAAVRHVQAPHAHAVDQHAQCTSLERSIRPLMPLGEARHAVERCAHIGDRQAARDRDAVPLIQAVHLDVVAGLFELRVGELLGFALDLLHRQHVDVFSDGELDGAGDAGADGVDVPGGQAHVSSLGLASYTGCRDRTRHRPPDPPRPDQGRGGVSTETSPSRAARRRRTTSTCASSLSITARLPRSVASCST